MVNHTTCEQRLVQQALENDLVFIENLTFKTFSGLQIYVQKVFKKIKNLSKIQDILEVGHFKGDFRKTLK